MKRNTRFCNTAFAGLLAAGLALALPARAQDVPPPDEKTAAQVFKQSYSPYAGRNYPTRPLFGDTHLHTALSFDAAAASCTLTPRDAYRFAKGEEVVSSTGQRVKLSQPLDFLAVTDHSDNMGLLTDLLAGKPELLAEPLGRKWYDMFQEGKAFDALYDILTESFSGKMPRVLTYDSQNPAFRSVWREIIKAADEANDPGRFTAFIGYEWSSNPGGDNLHRNVIFRDGGDKASQVAPYINAPPEGSNDPADLWKWMAAYEAKTGGQLLAIPHNGNLSLGKMFPMVEAFGGKPVDRAYVETRAKWEHLVEVSQIKGDSETHPLLSPNDEFADFERWDITNLDGTRKQTPDMFQQEYIRAALKNGLALEKKLGTNPYKFGLVGSTDSHTALSTAAEDNFFGKASLMEPSAHRWEHPYVDNTKTGLRVDGWRTSASGIAAVWATANTREAIFDAMQRRETYATTGSRLLVRFFGGWDFEPGDASNRMPAQVGYAKGVPMGGDLSDARKGKSPTFLVAAMKDPIGGNLDRYQIIKGWLDAKGELHEKVYDVAWSGNRKPGADGKLPSVGNTVDVANATWSNTIGAPELIAVWKDPDFDPAQRAFYYGRVIEIPTPRWTAYDQKRFGIKMADNVPMTVTDRAYTSPIWFTPAK